jgi:16S rRNA processing protein RimM
VTRTGIRLLPLGRALGHRGRAGELTVRVFRGGAERWNDLARVWMSRGEGQDAVFAVEASRAYKDRLVLKLEGIDDPTAAEALRGSRVAVAVEDAPELPVGEYYTALLVGMEVIDEQQRVVGRVVDVMPTGGKDVLVIRSSPDEGTQAGEEHEILVPLVAGMADVDDAAGVIRIRPPEGLLELNRD